MCEVLARALKEWDRRPLERHGFEPSAADCLAFKYMRDVSAGSASALRSGPWGQPTGASSPSFAHRLYAHAQNKCPLRTR
jgi:hypothetical protein